MQLAYVPAGMDHAQFRHDTSVSNRQELALRRDVREKRESWTCQKRPTYRRAYLRRLPRVPLVGGPILKCDSCFDFLPFRKNLFLFDFK